jgi:hypothetical protein
MNESIFSTYSTGENRVTASFLAVLRCLALPRIELILGALMEDADFQLNRETTCHRFSCRFPLLTMWAVRLQQGFGRGCRGTSQRLR